MFIDLAPAVAHRLVPESAEPDPRTGAQPLRADTSRTVELYPVRPDNITPAALWCGGTPTMVNGGPALLVDHGAGGVAGLGDFVVRDGRTFTAEPGAGIDQRFRLVEG